MGDVYGIIEGVNQGIGKAVMSKHLIRNSKDIRIKKYPKKYLREIYLSYYQQEYYPPILNFSVEQLVKNAKKFL